MTAELISQVRDQLDASPTPRHLVEFVGNQLSAAGFTDCTDTNSTEKFSSNGFIKRSGSIVAWRQGSKKIEKFRIIGAHTDSPCLKIKPHPDEARFGWQTLQVEVYGNPLLNSWLDRDLGIAGHAVLRDG